MTEHTAKIPQPILDADPFIIPLKRREEVDDINRIKAPRENGWQKQEKYAGTDIYIIQHITTGAGYGVRTGETRSGKNLIVIDADNMELSQWMRENMPKTFTVLSGRPGGTHFYYYSDYIDNKIILQKTIDGEEIHFGEIQHQGQYVVGPGSPHPSGNLYRAEDEEQEIIVLDEEHTKNLIQVFADPKHQKQKPTDKQYTQNIGTDDYYPFYEKDLKNPELRFMNVHDVEYKGICPFHDSTTGNNFSINTEKGTWYCFRHAVGGGVKGYIAHKHGLVDSCAEAANLKLTYQKYSALQEIFINNYNHKLPQLIDDFNSVQEKVFEYMASNQRQKATTLVANYMLKTEHIFTIRNNKAPECWIYQEGVYVPHGETYIKEMCNRMFRTALTSYVANEVILKIYTETYIDQNTFFNSHLQYRSRVPVQNGILDIQTRELYPFTPEIIFFHKLPVTYDVTKDCPNSKEFFRSLFTDQKDIDVLQEFFGFCLYKEYRYEKALMLSGTGSNGKSKTMDLLGRLVGRMNYSSVTLHSLEEDNFSKIQLHNKLVNICGEISHNTLRSTEMFKLLTGRDPILGDRKFLEPIQFHNYAKLVFSANTIPRTMDTSEGFYRRWIIIDFPFKFVPEDELEKLSDEEKVYAKKQDTHIIEKIITPDELSGLLNWSLEGFLRLQKNGKFSTNKTTEDIHKKWTRMSDSFSAFCMDYLENTDWNESLESQYIRKWYLIYCNAKGLKVQSEKSMAFTLQNEFMSSRQRVYKGTERVTIWKGVVFKKEIFDLDKTERQNEIKREAIDTQLPDTPEEKDDVLL